MSTPAISVILPTYNRAGRLARSVGSVLHQTFTDFELLVVDDGSTDDTRDVVEAFDDPRIRYIPRSRNGGVAATRNTGIEAARGQLLAFQDSDDEWLLGKLEAQIETLKHESECTMSICGVLRIGGRLLNYPRLPLDWQRGMTHRDALIYPFTYTQSWLVPRRAVIEAGSFDERLRIWDDWELLIRLSRELTIRPDPRPMVVSERAPDSLSVDSSRFLHDMPLILNRHEQALSRMPAEHAQLRYIYGRQLCVAGKLGAARTQLRHALRLRPTRPRPWALLGGSILGTAFMRKQLKP